MEKDKIQERGEVVRVEGDMAYIKFKRTSACGSCQACGLLTDMSEIIIDVQNTLGAKEGQWAGIEISTETSLKSTVIAYAFPLAMLIIGAIVGNFVGVYLFPDMTSDLFVAIGCLSFVAISYLIIRKMEPKFKSKYKSIYKMTGVYSDKYSVED